MEPSMFFLWQLNKKIFLTENFDFKWVKFEPRTTGSLIVFDGLLFVYFEYSVDLQILYVLYIVCVFPLWLNI